MVNQKAMHCLFCCFVMLFFSLSGRGQAAQVIDSLEEELKNTPANTFKRVDILNDLGFRYWVINSNQSLSYGNAALTLAKRLKYPKGEALAKRVLGVSYWTLGEPKLALENLMSAQKSYEDLGDMEGAANCLMNSGMVYADIGDYGTALDIYDRSIEKFTQLGLDQRIATTFTKIGTVLMEKNQTNEAKEFFNNALSMHTKDNYAYGQAEAHNRLGALFLVENELEQAEYHLEKASEISTRINDQDGIISTGIQVGKLLRLRNQNTAAEIQLTQALKTADLKQLSKYKLAALHELKLLKKQEGKAEEALEYAETFDVLKDSLYGANQTKQIAAMEFNRELREKSLELDYLKLEKRKNMLIQALLIGGITIITLLAIFLIRSLKLRNKNQIALLASNDLVAKTAIELQQLKNAELKKELDFKNRELAAYALNFLQKNELLKTLEDKITHTKNTSTADLTSYLKEIETTISQHKNIEKE